MRWSRHLGESGDARRGPRRLGTTWHSGRTADDDGAVLRLERTANVRFPSIGSPNGQPMATA